MTQKRYMVLYELTHRGERCGLRVKMLETQAEAQRFDPREGNPGRDILFWEILKVKTVQPS